MKRFTRSGAAALAAAGFSQHASAPPSFRGGPDHAVFVQNDRLAGNQIVAYSRSSEGTLTQSGVYDTGGDGGSSPARSSTTPPRRGALLRQRGQPAVAVNAGSNTISVFASSVTVSHCAR